MAKIIIQSNDKSYVWKHEFTSEDIYYINKESFGLLDALNKAAETDEKESK